MRRTMPDFVAPLVPSVVPTETMNKNALYDHLSTYHPTQVGYNRSITSKSSKDQMEALHTRLHEEYDYTQAEVAVVEDDQGNRWNVNNPTEPAEGEKRFAPFRDLVHEHLVVPVGTPTEDERDLLNKVTEGGLGRVLSVTERKALERLIDNDFASLRNEMRAYAEEILAERLKAVEEEFADRKKEAEKRRKAAIKALVKANKEIAKSLQDAKDAGITISGVTYSSLSEEHYEHAVLASIEGQKEAESKVRGENRNDLQTALHTLERQRLAAQRLVLLAGISPEGQKLLDTIPDAKTLMVEAAQERATKAITAGQDA